MSKPKFSANLGLLWRELPFIERIRKAGEAGFRAVEFHDHVKGEDVSEVRRVLDAFNLQVISLNVKMGETFGKAAIPGREDAARQDIDDAISLAEQLDARAIHVLPGCARGEAARVTFANNLAYALENTKKTILIEPISNISGYFLSSLAQVGELIDGVSHPRLKIMFDCFHIRHEYKNLEAEFLKNISHIGHVQIASFPDRQEPEDGKIEYTKLLPAMIEAGYEGWIGCEYHPAASVESGLNWMHKYRQERD